jgi:hypothetical protein
MRAMREKNISMQAINNKFDKIFGGIFKGYNRCLTKKMGALQQNILHLAQRGNTQEALDFQDIIEYTQCVNSNVLVALKSGVF